ncbi:MAG: hypothetical protein K8L99_26940 [Anaerolineae bacterium]|nr:hypothetical protein [Anaerolineae bacterium]
MFTQRRMWVLGLVFILGIACLLLVAGLAMNNGTATQTSNSERGFPIQLFVIFIAVAATFIGTFLAISQQRSSVPPEKPKRKNHDADDEPFDE